MKYFEKFNRVKSHLFIIIITYYQMIKEWSRSEHVEYISALFFFQVREKKPEYFFQQASS